MKFSVYLHFAFPHVEMVWRVVWKAVWIPRDQLHPHLKVVWQVAWKAVWKNPRPVTSASGGGMVGGAENCGRPETSCIP